MKSAEKWSEECGLHPQKIREIQADALKWALDQISPRGSFTISAKLEELES